MRRPNIPAQFALGVMAEQGLDMKCTPEAAAQWYAKAAQHGYWPAAYNLGRMYMLGEGIPRDPGLGARWFTFARQNGAPARLFGSAN
ncbi:MAG: hypothetical protein B7Z67_05090 [Acidiphilium sp. 21-60-14]|nr:MAG: hypothetical protein B7Z67_05090 [Acidiphilium sp. 21-60-14]